MPTRSRETFKKRQKEMLRVEKQRDKAAKRLARKSLPKETGDPDPDTEGLMAQGADGATDDGATEEGDTKPEQHDSI